MKKVVRMGIAFIATLFVMSSYCQTKSILSTEA